MSDERKKPGVAFWATVVVVVALVAYPLSWGPWCWYAHAVAHDRKLMWVGFYLPLAKLSWSGPAWISKPYNAYINWWIPDK